MSPSIVSSFDLPFCSKFHFNKSPSFCSYVTNNPPLRVPTIGFFLAVNSHPLFPFLIASSFPCEQHLQHNIIQHHINQYPGMVDNIIKRTDCHSNTREPHFTI
jgi:hypothetical protein